MNKSGMVVDTTEGMAKVMVVRAAGCGGNCKSCASCESKEHVVNLPNPLHAKIGDRVEVSANSSRVVRLTLLLYVVPLIFFLVGTILGILLLQDRVESFELYSFLLGAVFFGLSVIILRVIDRRYGSTNSTQLEITKIL